MPTSTEPRRRPVAPADPPTGTSPRLAPSRMQRYFGPILLWLFRVFFRPIKADQETVPRIRAAAEQGTVVYAMRSRSLLDYVYFNYYFLVHGLPLAAWANGIDTTWLLPWRQGLGAVVRWIRRQRNGAAVLAAEGAALKHHVRSGSSVVMFLRERRGADFLDRRDLLIELIDAQRHADTPIFLVPQTIVWGRRPKRAMPRLPDVLFGEREDGGRLRKILNFLWFHRGANVRTGDPIDLRTFLADHEAYGDQKAGRALSLLVRGALWREKKVVRGPEVLQPFEIADLVLAKPHVRAALEAEVAAGHTEEAVRARGRRILLRLAASYSHDVIQIVRILMDYVLNRIYSGVDFDPEAAERVRRAGRRGTVLLIPNHRSHLDYILVSWCMYHAQLLPPHIAAGANLSFWPLGPILRRCGAFFIRRTMAGDDYYKALLTGYLQVLCSKEYTQEFFIEGGRSRSGKMLAPKVGLLGMYVDAVNEGHTRDVQIVPIGIAYERVAEEGEYLRERSGAPKKRESIAALLRLPRVLRQRFGRVYLRVGEPISMKGWLSELGPGGGAGYRDAEESARFDLLNRLGNRITVEIERSLPVTPSAVAATALLAHNRRGLLHHEYESLTRRLLHQLRSVDARFSDAFERPEQALEGALKRFDNHRTIDLLDHGEADEPTVIAVDNSHRAGLDYYRNGLMGHLAPQALYALALAGAGEAPRETLFHRCLELARLFDREFFWDPRHAPEAWIVEAERRLVGEGALRLVDVPDEQHPPSPTPAGSPPVLTVIPGGANPLPNPDSSQALPLLGEPALPGSVSMDSSWPGRAVVIDPAALALHRGHVQGLLEAYYIVARAAQRLEREPLAQKPFLTRAQKYGRRLYLTEHITRSEALSQVTLKNAVSRYRRQGMLEVDKAQDPPLLRAHDVERRRWLAFLGPLLFRPLLESGNSGS